jgi:hypothetical protein
MTVERLLSFGIPFPQDLLRYHLREITASTVMQTVRAITIPKVIDKQ